jgi:hypothetical protein
MCDGPFIAWQHGSLRWSLISISKMAKLMIFYKTPLKAIYCLGSSQIHLPSIVARTSTSPSLTQDASTRHPSPWGEVHASASSKHARRAGFGSPVRYTRSESSEYFPANLGSNRCGWPVLARRLAREGQVQGLGRLSRRRSSRCSHAPSRLRSVAGKSFFTPHDC